MNLSERQQRAIQEQTDRGIWLNPAAGIQKRILADGFWPTHRELYDEGEAYLRAEHPRTGEARLYLWNPSRGVWWVPGTKGDGGADPPKDMTKFDSVIGLHLSADSFSAPQEFDEVRTLNPGWIKILSTHEPSHISKLRQIAPSARWIIRAFLSVGNRGVTPEQFVEWTLPTVERSLSHVGRPDTIIELHNEPNLEAEGNGSSWAYGAHFNWWYQKVLLAYRNRFPQYKFAFPGLSPGGTVTSTGDGKLIGRQSHKTFALGCREAINASDYLAVHAYWSETVPMEGATGKEGALQVVDWFRSSFPNKPIILTEASHNGPASPNKKASDYVRFTNRMVDKGVKGITFFVSSSINPSFINEIWVGNDIAEKLRAI